jgi:transcriptional regulator with XRE-family HTH domain
MDLQKLGAVLQARREALGIPRAEIARRVGVTPTYVWLIEGSKERPSGEPSKPSRTVLERWSRALGLDDRYMKQVLVLGGQADKRASSGAIREVNQPLEARQAYLAERRVFDRPASLSMDEPPDMDIAAMARAPLAFKEPRELQREVVLDQVRELFDEARNDGEWSRVVASLESFVGWLRSNLHREE